MVTSTFYHQNIASRSPFPQSCLDAALAYARAGLPVFPVSGKVPYPKTRGFHEATTDPAMIARWWHRWPNANVAIPTGKASGWIVLDVDGRHGGLASLYHLQAMLSHRLQDFHRDQPPWPATRVARTGSGIHLIFQMPQTRLRNTVSFAGLAGIDLRGDGGYIVVAPSLHPSGRRYSWLSMCLPAPFPSLLLDLLRQRERLRRLEAALQQQEMGSGKEQILTPARENPEYWLKKAVGLACIGKRHTYALWLACRLIEQARLSPGQAETYMHRYVEQVPRGCDDYPLSDALKCLQWAAEHVSPYPMTQEGGPKT